MFEDNVAIDPAFRLRKVAGTLMLTVPPPSITGAKVVGGFPITNFIPSPGPVPGRPMPGLGTTGGLPTTISPAFIVVLPPTESVPFTVTCPRESSSRFPGVKIPPPAATVIPTALGWMLTSLPIVNRASTLIVLPPPVGVVFPAKKAASVIVPVVPVNAAVSTRAPELNKIPFGLTRNTRPFDCRVPRIDETLDDATRLSTALLADC